MSPKNHSLPLMGGARILVSPFGLPRPLRRVIAYLGPDTAQVGASAAIMQQHTMTFTSFSQLGHFIYMMGLVLRSGPCLCLVRIQGEVLLIKRSAVVQVSLRTTRARES